jgi:hypothetical protein
MIFQKRNMFGAVKELPPRLVLDVEIGLWCGQMGPVPRRPVGISL